MYHNNDNHNNFNNNNKNNTNNHSNNNNNNNKKYNNKKTNVTSSCGQNTLQNMSKYAVKKMLYRPILKKI